MVFVATRQAPVVPHEAAAAPRRPDHLNIPNTADGRPHLRWRAVVHAAEKETVHTSWHLTACSAPMDPHAHCAQGQRLIETQLDPDGHCLVDGCCGRCNDPPR